MAQLLELSGGQWINKGELQSKGVFSVATVRLIALGVDFDGEITAMDVGGNFYTLFPVGTCSQICEIREPETQQVISYVFPFDVPVEMAVPNGN